MLRCACSSGAMVRTNEVATGVKKRASRVARVDGCVSLNHILYGSPSVPGVDLPPYKKLSLSFCSPSGLCRETLSGKQVEEQLSASEPCRIGGCQ